MFRRKSPEQKRVECVAAKTDEVYPGWYHHVNIDTLDLESSSRCVFGQLSEGLTGNRFSPGWAALADTVVPHDIDGRSTLYGNDRHRRHWIAAIAQRHQAEERELAGLLDEPVKQPRFRLRRRERDLV